ncbi:MAG TPA: hypothetical protein VHL81_12115, partial [Gemmatimonadales bacterium]|nr:hypothetical protein [Gemmatimonadales bacterium]
SYSPSPVFLQPTVTTNAAMPAASVSFRMNTSGAGMGDFPVRQQSRVRGHSGLCSGSRRRLGAAESYPRPNVKIVDGTIVKLNVVWSYVIVM